MFLHFSTTHMYIIETINLRNEVYQPHKQRMYHYICLQHGNLSTTGCVCVCVCVTIHQSVQYVQIMVMFLMLNIYSSPTRPTCLNCFWIVICSYFHPTTPHQQPFVVIPHLCLTCSPSPLLVRNLIHLDVAHTCPPPASAAHI